MNPKKEEPMKKERIFVALAVIASESIVSSSAACARKYIERFEAGENVRSAETLIVNVEANEYKMKDIIAESFAKIENKERLESPTWLHDWRDIDYRNRGFALAKAEISTKAGLKALKNIQK